MQEQKSMTLREERSEGNYRYLEASYSHGGDLHFNGQDLGGAVEGFFGAREYEWNWTIRSSELPKLATALGSPDLLAALKEKFSGSAAAGLQSFLEEHYIPYEASSRTGD